MSTYDLTVYVGSSLEVPFKYVTGTAAYNMQPFDLTSWSAVFRLRDQDNNVILEVRDTDTGQKSLSLGGAAGTLTVSVAASLTSRFQARRGFYELEIFASDIAAYRIINGKVSYVGYGRDGQATQTVIIQQTSRSVTVERPWVTSVQYVDRGIPGPRGAVGADGPTVEVNSTRIGAVPALTQAYGRPVARADNNAIVYSREAIPAKAFDALYADDQSRLQAAINAAAALYCAVQLESREYTGLSYLDMHNMQGVVLLGSGGSSFSSGGTTLRFDSTPTQVSGTSASAVSITAGRGVTKTFVLNSGVGVVANQPIKLTATAGTTGAIWGRVSSIVDTTCVVSVFAITGSGTGTAWSWVHTPTPLIDLRSTKGCGLKGINIRLNTVCINHVVDTSQYPGGAGDSDGLVLEQLICVQATNGGTNTADYQAVHYNLNNALSCGAYLCRSFGALLGMFVGNGPFALHDCIFTDYSYMAIECVAIAVVIDSCTFEPGYAFDGSQIQDGVYGHDNSAGSITLIGNVWNDYANTATGRLVYASALGIVSIIGGNVFSASATQAPIFVTACQKYLEEGNEFVPGLDKRVEFGSTGGNTVQARVGVSTFTGTTPIVGTANVTDLIQDDAVITRTDGSGIPGIKRNFAQFFSVFVNFGLIVAQCTVDLTSGVDLSFSTTNISNGSAGAGFIYTLAAIDDGLCLDFVSTVAATVTIKNNNTAGSAGGVYRKVLTGTGADVVIPAGSATQPQSWRLRYRSSLSAFVLENVYP